MRAAERKPQSDLSRLADRRTLPASATSTATLWKPTYDARSSRIQRPSNYDARDVKHEKPRRGSSEKFSPIVPRHRARNSATELGLKSHQLRLPHQGYQFWDFENYLAETDDQNEIQAVYTNEPQQYGNLISQYRKDGAIWTPSYYQYDALGSTRALTDEGGDASDTYIYDAWGNEIAVTGTTVNPFRWVGRVGYYWDEGSGTFYIRKRTYDPPTGRWMSVDPAAADIILYLYCRNGPLIRLDPSGLYPVWPDGSRIGGDGDKNRPPEDIINALGVMCTCATKVMTKVEFVTGNKKTLGTTICRDDVIDFEIIEPLESATLKEKIDYALRKACGVIDCVETHEENHVNVLKKACAKDLCKDKKCAKDSLVLVGFKGAFSGLCSKVIECYAYKASLSCAADLVKKWKGNASCEPVALEFFKTQIVGLMMEHKCEELLGTLWWPGELIDDPDVIEVAEEIRKQGRR